MTYSFSTALAGIKDGEKWRRAAWKPNKHVQYNDGGAGLCYIEIVYPFEIGKRAPWTPTRCDLFENDWEQSEL